MAPQKAFSEQMCTALNDPNVINAFGKIISDRVMEALGAMENRLRACEASIKAKDERIEQLQSRLKKAENHHDNQMDMIDEMEQYSRRNSVRIHHPGWIENNEENCSSLICNYAKDHHITLTPNDIDACHRVGKKEPGRVRPIIVKFVRRDDRTALLSTRRIQREARSRIFINEDLTPRRAMAAKLSRALVQSNKLRKAYVMSGAVMIETNDGQKIKITDIKQITRYQ